MKQLFIVNTGDDIAEGLLDDKGNVLGIWSLNDGYWSSYFNDAFQNAGIEIIEIMEYDHPFLEKLRRHAMEYWGLSADEVGLEDQPNLLKTNDNFAAPRIYSLFSKT